MLGRLIQKLMISVLELEVDFTRLVHESAGLLMDGGLMMLRRKQMHLQKAPRCKYYALGEKF